MSAETAAPTPAARPASGRMAAVNDMARLLRLLFEVEREFLRTVTTLIYRVGEPELKYLLCQHAWESAGHARFLRERGRELTRAVAKPRCICKRFNACCRLNPCHKPW